MQRTMIAILLLTASILGSCGDGAGPTSPPPPPPIPSANIVVTANGSFTLHPSAASGFAIALEIPIQIEETAGGSATWNFFRVSWFLNGQQVERREAGSTEIRDNGFADISPNSTVTPAPIVRSNASDFDDVQILLRFTDKNTGTRTERSLSLLSDFDGVLVDLTPRLLPEGSDFSISGR